MSDEGSPRESGGGPRETTWYDSAVIRAGLKAITAKHDFDDKKGRFDCSLEKIRFMDTHLPKIVPWQAYSMRPDSDPSLLLEVNLRDMLPVYHRIGSLLFDAVNKPDRVRQYAMFAAIFRFVNIVRDIVEKNDDEELEHESKHFE